MEHEIALYNDFVTFEGDENFLYTELMNQIALEERELERTASEKSCIADVLKRIVNEIDKSSQELEDSVVTTIRDVINQIEDNIENEISNSVVQMEYNAENSTATLVAGMDNSAVNETSTSTNRLNDFSRYPDDTDELIVSTIQNLIEEMEITIVRRIPDSVKAIEDNEENIIEDLIEEMQKSIDDRNSGFANAIESFNKSRSPHSLEEIENIIVRGIPDSVTAIEDNTENIIEDLIEEMQKSIDDRNSGFANAIGSFNKSKSPHSLEEMENTIVRRIPDTVTAIGDNTENIIEDLIEEMQKSIDDRSSGVANVIGGFNKSRSPHSVEEIENIIVDAIQSLIEEMEESIVDRIPDTVMEAEDNNTIRDLVDAMENGIADNVPNTVEKMEETTVDIIGDLVNEMDRSIANIVPDSNYQFGCFNKDTIPNSAYNLQGGNLDRYSCSDMDIETDTDNTHLDPMNELEESIEDKPPKLVREIIENFVVGSDLDDEIEDGELVDLPQLVKETNDFHNEDKYEESKLDIDLNNHNKLQKNAELRAYYSQTLNDMAESIRSEESFSCVIHMKYRQLFSLMLDYLKFIREQTQECLESGTPIPDGMLEEFEANKKQYVDLNDSLKLKFTLGCQHT